MFENNIENRLDNKFESKRERHQISSKIRLSKVRNKNMRLQTWLM